MHVFMSALLAANSLYSYDCGNCTMFLIIFTSMLYDLVKKTGEDIDPLQVWIASAGVRVRFQLMMYYSHAHVTARSALFFSSY